MNREEFLRELEKSLRGKVDEREIARQVQYYDSYITNEMNCGRTLEDIMEELGSPRLIAKTIIQTYSIKDNPINRHYSNNDNRYEEFEEDSAKDRIKIGVWKIITVIVTFMILILVLGIIFSVLKYVVPLVVIILALYIIFKLIT